MVGPFQELDIVFGLLEGGKPQILGLYNESLPLWLLARGKPKSEGVIHDLFERTARLPHFLLQQGDNIVVESKSTSHIMMLAR